MMIVCCINPLHLKKTRPRVLWLQRKLIRGKVFKDINNVKSIRNVHINWKINLLSIISNLLKNGEITNFLVFKFIVHASRKMIFAKMDYY